MSELNSIQIILLGVIFIWTGFVRSGLGFGGAALGLPLMLLILPQPLFFLPIIGTHLLFFSSITLFTRLQNVAWEPMLKALLVMSLPMIAGILGLLNLPGEIMSLLVFVITLFYGVSYAMNYQISSDNLWLDTVLLIIGGYVSGASLIGAPLIVAVLSHHVAVKGLRDTLLMMWFILVSFKMSAFIIAEVDLQLRLAVQLLPIAAIGHFIGLRAHDYILSTGGATFKRYIGAAMVLVAMSGLIQLFLP